MLLQDVVFALAHATGKIGRFTLIERWRSNERLLAPNENPLKVVEMLHIYNKLLIPLLRSQLSDLDEMGRILE